MERRIGTASLEVMGLWRWMEHKVGVLGQAGGVAKDRDAEGPAGRGGRGEPGRGVALGGRGRFPWEDAPSGSPWKASWRARDE